MNDSKIVRKERTDGVEGYEYSMAPENGMVIPVIKVGAEVGGHGCLYKIEMPTMGVYHDDFGRNRPHYADALKLLSAVLRDYHCGHQIVKGDFEVL